PEPLPDPRLAASAAVGIRRVEPVETEAPGSVHERERVLFRLALSEERGRRADAAEVTAAEHHRRDLNAGGQPRDSMIEQTPKGVSNGVRASTSSVRLQRAG